MAVVDLVGWKTEVVGLSMRWKVGLHLVRDWVSRHGQLRVPPEVSGGELHGSKPERRVTGPDRSHAMCMSRRY